MYKYYDSKNIVNIEDISFIEKKINEILKDKSTLEIMFNGNIYKSYNVKVVSLTGYDDVSDINLKIYNKIDIYNELYIKNNEDVIFEFVVSDNTLMFIIHNEE